MMTTNNLRTLKNGAVLLDERNETLWVVESKMSKERIVNVSSRINRHELRPVPYDVIKAYFVQLASVTDLVNDIKPTETKKRVSVSFDELVDVVTSVIDITDYELKKRADGALAVKHDKKLLFRVSSAGVNKETGAHMFLFYVNRIEHFTNMPYKVHTKANGTTYATITTDNISIIQDIIANI